MSNPSNHAFHEDRCGKCIYCKKQLNNECEEHEKVGESKRQIFSENEVDGNDTEPNKKERKLNEIKCEISEESFTGLRAKGHLKRHIEEQHKESKYVCDICDELLPGKKHFKDTRNKFTLKLKQIMTGTLLKCQFLNLINAIKATQGMIH